MGNVKEGVLEYKPLQQGYKEVRTIWQTIAFFNED